MMRLLVVAVAGTMLVGGSVRISEGQLSPPPGFSQDVPQDMSGRRALDPAKIHRAEEMAKARNEDRQKRLVTDTDKLLALATDLKAQMDQSSVDALSIDGRKKVEEIEKLAHSVKERMKG
jgi:hypothetical protein